MTTDELLNRIAAQPVISVERNVYVPGPQLKALLAEEKPILLSEIMAHPDQQQELRAYRYAHVAGAGLCRESVEAWQAEHREHSLPLDLMEFLTRVNGLHLWADLGSSHAYFGVLPLSGWQDAKDVGWAMMFDVPPSGQLVISYHDNGDNFLVLDTRAQEYLWYDLEDFSHPKRVGRTVGELLDFWWRETDWLNPRRS